MVSYYTRGNGYEAEADRLRDSCERHGILHVIEAVEDLGDWQANTRFKAQFMLDKRRELGGPIVWLDADAEVKSYPHAFDVLDGDYDLAVHYRRGTECLSGTVWVADTKIAQGCLARWVACCEKHPKTWDQRCLHTAIGQAEGLRLHHLPASYCCIFDAKDMLTQGEPVILHHQASRRLKRGVGGAA